MGKRTLRTLHYELVASVIREELEKTAAPGYIHTQWIADGVIGSIARRFADEFEIRGQTFDRAKFLKSCGIDN